MARKKKTEEMITDEVKESEVETEKAEVVPLTAIEKINDFLYNKVKFLTRKPPIKLTRSAENIAERQAAAKAKRERKNAKRLRNRG